MAAVLRYHQLPALRAYPVDFVSGQGLATRDVGHNLTVTYAR